MYDGHIVVLNTELNHGFTLEKLRKYGRMTTIFDLFTTISTTNFGGKPLIFITLITICQSPLLESLLK